MQYKIILTSVNKLVFIISVWDTPLTCYSLCVKDWSSSSVGLPPQSGSVHWFCPSVPSWVRIGRVRWWTIDVSDLVQGIGKMRNDRSNVWLYGGWGSVSTLPFTLLTGRSAYRVSTETHLPIPSSIRLSFDLSELSVDVDSCPWVSLFRYSFFSSDLVSLLYRTHPLSSRSSPEVFTPTFMRYHDR